ncbi:MAG: glycosyltransferase family 4 protein [Candidatus Omnitrophota bacterium]
MKILFVNRYIEETGGVEYYIRALASRLKEKGHQTGIVHWDESKDIADFDSSSRINILWDMELDLGRKAGHMLGEVLRDFSPDVVYLHNMENGKTIDYLARREHVVRYIHGYKTVDPDGRMLLQNPLEINPYPLSPTCFLRAFTRLCMPRNPVKGIKAYLRAKRTLEATKGLNDVIVASEHMKKTLIKNGIRNDRVTVLPYFVDYVLSQEDAVPDKRRMLFAGRIIKGKGLDLLLDVLGLVKEDFVLDVVGTGPMEDILKKEVEARELTDKVIFHGWIDHRALPEFYKRALFLVMPSVWPEPFGICGIEAAFFGRSAVAFDVGGISDWLVDGETGFLVDPYNKKKMVEKITYFLKNPDKALESGQKAKKLALEKYNPELHIEKLLRIFRS